MLLKKHLKNSLKFIIDLIITRYERHTNYLKNKNITRNIIKQLQLELNKTNNTLELIQEPVKQLEKVPKIEDHILIYINQLIDKIDKVNNYSKKEKYKKEVKDILDNYSTRFKQIEENDDKLSLNTDNILKLQNDIIKDIVDLELRIDEDLKDQQSINNFNKQTKPLYDRLKIYSYKYTPSNQETKSKINSLRQTKPLCKTRRIITGYRK